MPSTSEIKKGIVLKWEGELWLITEFQHVNPGKGSAFVRTKMKNVRTGKAIENTFKTSETITIEELTKKKMQYLYGDGETYNFMDPANYEQVMLSADVVGENARFFKEGLEVIILYQDESPITLELPKKITYKVINAPEAVRGDSSSGRVTKEITLENGLKIQVPIFIKEGEEVIVNTETGQCAERA